MYPPDVSDIITQKWNDVIGLKKQILFFNHSHPHNVDYVTICIAARTSGD